MQLAERWFDPSPRRLVAALALALGAVALGAAPDAGTEAHVDLTRQRCVEDRVAIPDHVDHAPIAVELVEVPEPASVADRLAALDVSRCFHGEARVDLLIDVAADGQVTHVSTRPERPTRTSRCIAREVRGLRFAPSDTAVSVRYAFTP